MPTGTTRFLTNMVPTLFAYYGPGYNPLPFLAGAGIENLLNQDRYAVAAVDGVTTGREVARILCDFGNARNFYYIGVLNLDTGPLVGYSVQFDFEFLSTTATNTMAGCTVSGSTLTAPSSLLVAGFVANELVTGSGIPATNSAVFIESIAVGGLTATLSSADYAGTGTISGFKGVAPATRVAFSLLGTGGGRNSVVALPTVINARRVVVSFSVPGAAISFSRFLFAPADIDLGVSYMAGTTDAVVRQRTRTVTAGGTPVTNEPGRPYRRMNLRFGAAPQALRYAINTQAAAAPGLILTAEGEFFEWDLDGDVLEQTILWGSPDLYDITLPIRTLP